MLVCTGNISWFCETSLMVSDSGWNPTTNMPVQIYLGLSLTQTKILCTRPYSKRSDIKSRWLLQRLPSIKKPRGVTTQKTCELGTDLFTHQSNKLTKFSPTALIPQTKSTTKNNHEYLLLFTCSCRHHGHQCRSILTCSSLHNDWSFVRNKSCIKYHQQQQQQR